MTNEVLEDLKNRYMNEGWSLNDLARIAASEAATREREGCRKDIRNAILSLPESQRANGDLCDEAIADAIRKRSVG